jgi:AraC-like DNA-binding protein
MFCRYVLIRRLPPKFRQLDVQNYLLNIAHLIAESGLKSPQIAEMGD